MPDFRLDNLTPLPFKKAARKIQSGWLLQFRGNLVQSKWIQFFTAGIHSHSAMAGHVHGKLSCMEMLQFKGGRTTPLLDRVNECPGIIDVFSPNLAAFPHYDGEAAAQYMFGLTGKGYGYRGIARLLAMRTPYLRRWIKFNTNDALKSDWQPFCSHATAAAAQFGGGQDAVPRKANCLVTPHDHFQSLLWKYEFTLEP